jgi:ABC-type Zn2+ transport system substrate-binding protein/surface adhesin
MCVDSIEMLSKLRQLRFYSLLLVNYDDDNDDDDHDCDDDDDHDCDDDDDDDGGV